MKIPLTVREHFGQLMPFAFISLRGPRIRPRPIWVLVDTGSPWTAITPYDSMLANVPSSKLKRNTEYPEVLFANCKFWRSVLEGASLRIKDETGRVVTFDMPSISILTPTTKTSFERFKGISSVLGCDFITIHEFCLHFDPSKDIAFLEKTEEE